MFATVEFARVFVIVRNTFIVSREGLWFLRIIICDQKSVDGGANELIRVPRDLDMSSSVTWSFRLFILLETNEFKIECLRINFVRLGKNCHLEILTGTCGNVRQPPRKDLACTSFWNQNNYPLLQSA